MTTQTEQEILAPESTLAVFEPFVAELKEFEETNKSLVFDYETKDGQKQARSHVAKIRTLRAAIKKAKESATAGYREKTKIINAKGAEYDAQVLEMIDVHLKPVEAAEQRESDRKTEILGRIDEIKNCITLCTGKDAAEIEDTISQVQRIEPTEARFSEFYMTAEQVINDTLEGLNAMLAQRKEYEAEQEELIRLRGLQAEQDEKERIEREARQAEEAKKEAERAELQRKLDAAEAEKQRLIDEAAKAEAERLRDQENQKRLAEQQERNQQHREAIHEAIKTSFITVGGMHEDGAEMTTKLIVDDLIPHIKVVY